MPKMTGIFFRDRKNMHIKKAFFLCLVCLPVIALAMANDGWEDFPAPYKEPAFKPLITAEFAPSWPVNLVPPQTIVIQPDVEKRYVPSIVHSPFFLGDLFFGFQKNINRTFNLQFGLEGLFASNSHFDGVIWDDADSKFDNYNYSFNVEHKHIAVKSKLLMPLSEKFNFYFSLGLGVGFNRANNYTSTPLIYEAIATPNFGSNSSSSFVYTLGIGAERRIWKQLCAGIGYEFGSWGKAQLGPGVGTLASGPELPNMYVNSLMASITYFIE